MTKKQFIALITRIAFSIFLLSLGILALLKLNETRSLALVDLSDVAIQTMTTTADNETLYANVLDSVKPSGLYRSTDNGRSWQAVSTGPGLAFNTLTISPIDQETLYAGTAGGPLGLTNNVWRSQDGGQTWHNFNLSLPASPARVVPAVTAIVADPDQPGVLYVGTDGQGVYRIKDGELGFELVGGLSLYDAHVKSMVMATDGRLYTLTESGLFVADGNRWHKLETIPETPVSLAVAAGDPQTLYVGGPTMGAYRSADGGQTWQPSGTGLGIIPGAALRVTALTVDGSVAEHVVAATAYGLGRELAPGAIYESYDGGQTWTKLDDLHSLANQLTFNQGGIIAATADGLKRYGEPDQVAPVPRWRSLLQRITAPLL